MIAADICTPKVRTVRPQSPVQEAARRMRDHRVGSLVVIGRKGPVEGMITDRDIVVRCVAGGLDPETTTVSEVMTRGMVAISRETGLEQALEVMAERKVRRLVVTDEEGELVGLLALDDVLESLEEEPPAVGRLLRSQVPV